MNPFKEDKVGKAKEEARDFWQLKEKDGEIWLTYNGAPVIPESMLKKPALETLLEVRELYVKSKSISQNAET
jgi:hypothetical protein